MGDQRLTFDFQKCLGTGGFGEVYLAALTRPGGLTKKVAVKVLKQDLRHADAAVQRLRDEGRMLAILNHPCILRVLEMTLIQGRVALVTEYIDGVDLALCCRKGFLLPQTVVLGALGEVASALHTAWTTPSPETGKPLKLIHRDVKPENIRIGKHGEVKLLDFGIARTTEMFRHAKTAQGDLPFTPGYAAPEAFTKGFQGSASDIYALGVSMFRLLVGERFYQNMELSDQVTMCCLPERYASFLRQRLSIVEAPDRVVELLRDMLAYDPEPRPAAATVEKRCAALSDNMSGPSHVRWARAQTFPEPKGLPNGSLTGKTLQEDLLQSAAPRGTRGVKLKPRSADAAQRLLEDPGTRSQPHRRPAAVADLTPPLVDVPSPPPPQPSQGLNPTPPAPPVPSGIRRIQSLRPITAPFPRPGGEGGTPGPAPPRLDPNLSIKSTLDAFVDEELLAQAGVDRDSLLSEPEPAPLRDMGGLPGASRTPAPSTLPLPDDGPVREGPSFMEGAALSTLPLPEELPTAPLDPPKPPATAAAIEPRRPVATQGSSVVRFAVFAIGIGTLVGGGIAMLAGIGFALLVYFS